jgi:hypothetical protein
MRKTLLFTIMLTLPSCLAVLFSQTNCKVLIPSISDSYTGSCKQGLADGKGEAYGVDQYIGDFKKGLPNGKGTYIWQTGSRYEGSWKNGMRDGDGKYTFKNDGRDSVLSGIWKEDKYVGIKAVAPYVVQYLSGISRVSCIRAGEVPYVKYKFSRSGGKAEENDIQNLTFQGSTGQESVQTDFVGFEQVTFPFEGKVRFEAPNTLNTTTVNCELRLLINQPGSWTVTIYF